MSDPGPTSRAIGVSSEGGELTLHVEACDRFDQKVREVTISDGTDRWARPEWKLKAKRPADQFSVSLSSPTGWKVEGDAKALASISFPFAVHLESDEGEIGNTIFNAAPPPGMVRVTGSDRTGEGSVNMTAEEFRAAAQVECAEW